MMVTSEDVQEEGEVGAESEAESGALGTMIQDHSCLISLVYVAIMNLFLQ